MSYEKVVDGLAGRFGRFMLRNLARGALASPICRDLSYVSPYPNSEEPAT